MKSDASRSVTRIAVRGSVAGVADAERRRRSVSPVRRARRLHGDVARPHPIDDVLHDRGLALLGIQVELANDLLQPRAVQDLLVERRQPILEPGADGRLDVVLGNLLRHDQHQRLGAIAIGQTARDDRGRRGDDQQRHHERPLAAPEDAQNRFRCVALAWQHELTD